MHCFVRIRTLHKQHVSLFLLAETLLANDAGETGNQSGSQSQNSQNDHTHISTGRLDDVVGGSSRGGSGQRNSALDIGVAAQILRLDVAAVVALVAAHSASPVVVTAGLAGIELSINSGGVNSGGSRGSGGRGSICSSADLYDLIGREVGNPENDHAVSNLGYRINRCTVSGIIHKDDLVAALVSIP